MTARAASEADIPALIVLNGVVQSWHADAYPTWFKAEVPPDHLDSFFRDVLTRPDAWLWVAETGDGPAGYLFATLHTRDGSPITHPRRMLHIKLSWWPPNTDVPATPPPF